MRILLACEESQAVCKAFRKRGHDAFSCDIQESSGGHPEWHIRGSVLDHLNDGWDMMIGFPPCTYLSSVQTFMCRKDELRVIKRINAADFFMKLMTASIEKIALENPTGVMSHIYRAPDQIIHPYYFGDTEMKRTALWLKGLPKLVYTEKNNLFEQSTFGMLSPPVYSYFHKGRQKMENIRNVSRPFVTGKERSKLSEYIAEAMADQLG